MGHAARFADKHVVFGHVQSRRACTSDLGYFEIFKVGLNRLLFNDLTLFALLVFLVSFSLFKDPMILEDS